VHEAAELVRLTVNRTAVQERGGRGRRGYGRLLAARFLVFAQLVGIHKDEALERYMRENRGIARILGFREIPDRATIGRWKQKLAPVTKETFEKLSAVIGMLAESELLAVDSTPLEDPHDPDAEWGFYSRGAFKGFKVHVSVDQEGLPRKALVTPGNRHDSPFLPELVEGQRAKHVVADAGYDAKENRRACRRIGAKPHIARNPRRSGKHRYTPALCKRKRYVVEQFNSRLKEMLQGCWVRFKGLARKATIVYCALIAMLAIALKALIEGRPELLRKVGLYRR